MCVDGPEDRGSIAEYGSPDRMPVLSRKERTLPMRSLPAAFAVFRIPPFVVSSPDRHLASSWRTLPGRCPSSMPDSLEIPGDLYGCARIAVLVRSFCLTIGLYPGENFGPGYPEWESFDMFSRTLSKRRASHCCETHLKTNNRRNGWSAFRLTIHCA